MMTVRRNPVASQNKKINNNNKSNYLFKKKKFCINVMSLSELYKIFNM